MAVWISRLVVLIDWALALIVDNLYVDLDRSKAAAEGRETARLAEERRLVAAEGEGRAAAERARIDAERASTERERVRVVTPTAPGGESAAATDFDRLIEED